ncbi:SPOR domain-containing protein [Tahibacter amnicola]|uniref:SPOR domain-containing protein n=1 Tax=Tahibacter amnicola TaxID=2976241 RepID=A0ABY6BGG9_9GAMM|nr:SPOR domain-containing protein [Tahibacter amnicola]UXI66957.1 SPOR domain-containing protein [Tahibacter amnicola]
MDSQLKQRLIGAAVLIVLAIIFVPMFLSGSPPKQDTVTENLAIPPAPEREFQTRVVPADGGKATIPTPAPAAVPPVAPSSNTDKVTTVEADKNPRVEVPYDQPPPTQAKTDPRTPPPVAPVKPPVERVLPTATAHGRFAVHLGVFTSNANADALVGAARKQGISAYTETADVDGKPATRVRLGPFEDRATAESARLKLQQADAKFKGSVVEIAATPKADAPAAALPANRAGGWAVQLGAFKSPEEANKLLARVKGAGFSSYVDTTGQGAEKLWRVRVGPEADRGNTEKLRDAVKQKLTIAGMIVTVP